MKLSDDAKAVLGAYFFGGTMQTTLIFHMVDSRPSERAERALKELEDVGLIRSEPFNKFGGVVYSLTRPLEKQELASFRKAALESGNWSLTQPVKPKSVTHRT